MILDACDTLGIHGGAALRVLNTFIEGNSRLFYMTKWGTWFRQLNEGSQVFGAGAATMELWLYVVSSFFRRYWTQEVLANAHEKVTKM